ncbi:hypothetical protein F5Y19DRAFT_481082 [Xylariaceae sp. FL1651]|nr:hypothetical protein F5Y19DRAFT_481082 [Xylariaceae sp. FL1651]
MPGTPTFSKAVHFDSHLEHVRHFLQVDRPIAVSSWSPPIEAYDSESEHPSDEDHQPKRGEWEIEIPKFPSESSERRTMPIRVERIFLASDHQTLVCTVACADIAPQKLVICRFTLDNWLTSSEVVAEYNHDFGNNYINEGYNRLDFKIQLAHHKNLESKTMLLCVRYTVGGQEYWDGYGATNYKVYFIKKASPRKVDHMVPQSLPRSRLSSQTLHPKNLLNESLNDGFGNHLKFVSGQDNLKQSPRFPESFPLNQAQNFSTRYDFSASLAAAMSSTQKTPIDHGGIKSKPSSGATYNSTTRPNTLFSEKPNLHVAEYSGLTENNCAVQDLDTGGHEWIQTALPSKTLVGKDLSNAQMALGGRGDVESESSSGAAPIPGARPNTDNTTTSVDLTPAAISSSSASLPADYGPTLLTMPFSSMYEEAVLNEPKKVETNPSDSDNAVTMSEEKKSTNEFVLERGESNLEGSTLLDTDESLTARVEEHAVLDSTKGTDDYMSVSSNDEDIASQAARQRTEQEILAVKLFSLFFAESVELSDLHENALGKLGPSRFRENYRRILKSYVLKLRIEARTALEKDTVKVIESRGNRRSIAKQIINLLTPKTEEHVKPLDELTQRPLMKQNLEDWARTVYGLPDATLDIAPEPPEYSSEESEEDESYEGVNGQDNEHLETLTYTNIEKAYNFLHQSVPFRTLVLQLALLGLPVFWRDIIETSPKHSIKISAKNDTSFMNRTKGIVEAYTATRWDWWPLAPWVPEITPGRLRLEWRFCHQPLYKEISLEEAALIRQIMDIIDEHPPKCHCCKVPSSQLGWYTAFLMLFEALVSRLPVKFVNPSSTGMALPSRAHLRYTPTTTSTMTETLSSLGVQQCTPNLSPNLSASGNTGTQAQPSGSGNKTPADSFWVVFGIRDMRGFDAIENIRTHVGLEDTSFFQDMRRRRGRHRWFFQRWFSPYRFRYCRFVQFERIIVDEVSSCGEALPDDHGYTIDYTYRPRPPAARKPLIDPARFSVLLKTCNSLCYWSLLPKLLHKCRRLPVNSKEWLRIPQKKGVFGTTTDLYSSGPQIAERVAFGIEADYLPSNVFFFLYHAILILSGFGFWIYWLREHPGDLQNASVPLFTIFALIAAFWAFLGKGAGT